MTVSILDPAHPDLGFLLLPENADINTGIVADAAGNYDALMANISIGHDGRTFFSFAGNGFLKIDIPAKSIMDYPAAGMAIEVEVRLGVTDDQMLFSRYGAGNKDVQLWIDSGVSYWRVPGTTAVVTSPAPVMNELTHFVVQYDGVDWTVYREASLAGHKASVYIPTSNSEPLFIGADADAANGGLMGNYITGKIYKVRGFTRPLTLSEIETLLTERHPYELSGTVTLDGIADSRAIGIYDAGTMALIKKLTADSNGDFRLLLADNSPVFITCMPPFGYKPITHGPIIPAPRNL